MLYDILIERDLDEDKYPVLKSVFSELTQKETTEIMNELRELDKNINSGIVYNEASLFHGRYHVEKVFMYTYIIIKKLNSKLNDSQKIDDNLKKILFDAALYHDIGRVNDNEDTIHGLISANLFFETFKDNKFYKDDVNYKCLLSALMSAHSINDLDYMRILEDSANNNDLLFYNRETRCFELGPELKEISDKIYPLLLSILKDADALDRARFGKWDLVSLNVSYLRLEESTELVAFATELNALYYNRMTNNYLAESEMKFETIDCFHSIGFDFFKIESIIRNGILSQDAMKKNGITVPRNFMGGNLNRWISVVDASRLYERFNETVTDFDPSKVKKYAFNEFTKHGITFYCSDVQVVNAVSDFSKAIETGMPWNKSGYCDERYAFEKILPQKIVGLTIPNKFVHADIEGLRYIYPSLDMDLIKSRTKYYCTYTGIPASDKLLQLLDEYKDETLNFLNINLDDKETYKRISYEYEKFSINIVDKINLEIGKILKTYYKNCIQSTSDLTVLDVLNYELSKVITLSEKRTIIPSINEQTKELIYIFDEKENKRIYEESKGKSYYK